LARRRLVLVVDDEAYVRDVTVRALAAAGVTALAAGSGPEGIELMERHRDEVALVLLNLIMPGLGAADTLTALRRLYPNLKVLLTTGHDQDDARRFCEEWKLAGFLHKPYTLEELFGKVRAALGAG
jgi:CheY-like chemotaxis protein